MAGSTPSGAAGVTIRNFTERDVAPAHRVTNHYIVHTAIHFASTPAPDSEFAAYWTEGAAGYPWLAAEVDGAFAGYAKAAQWRSREAYRPTAEVGLYIDPAFQGRGVGRLLYGALIERCRAMGFHSVVGGIALPNDASVKLHEACGFRFVGTFREVGRKFDAWHDVGFWQLEL